MWLRIEGGEGGGRGEGVSLWNVMYGMRCLAPDITENA